MLTDDGASGPAHFLFFFSTASLGQVVVCVRPTADGSEVQVMRAECRAGKQSLGSKQI